MVRYGKAKLLLMLRRAAYVLPIWSLAVSALATERLVLEDDTAKSGRQSDQVKLEHDMIGNAATSITSNRNEHPDAQWFPDAKLGLFLHWGIYSVKNLNNSWPMIPGRILGTKKLDAAELARVIRERDYNLNGKSPEITPNEFWKQAKDFNPRNYNPELWAKAAKDAGFTYAVLTTKHHDGYALWPSEFGGFSTREYMGGMDLIKPFVDACRKYDLKVGLYYSPPDWYFDREYMNFMYYKAPKLNAGLPVLDADLRPRTWFKTETELKAHQAEFAARVRGQVRELLTRWGKIDLLWFDGKAPIPNGGNVITLEEIRTLQPGIVVNPRMHGKGDFVTYERTPPLKDPGKIWAEYCNTWTSSWSNSSTYPFRSNGFIIGQLVSSRAWGVNYLLGVGPTDTGELPDGVYRNMKVIAEWMKVNGKSLDAGELPSDEIASVPATASEYSRYLFVVPEFKPTAGYSGPFDSDMLAFKDQIVTLKTSRTPVHITLLGSSERLAYTFQGSEVRIIIPASCRTRLVDVVEIVMQ